MTVVKTPKVKFFPKIPWQREREGGRIEKLSAGRKKLKKDLTSSRKDGRIKVRRWEGAPRILKIKQCKGKLKRIKNPEEIPEIPRKLKEEESLAIRMSLKA